jgi:molybdenum cofactor cytidylyltransferase
MAMEADKGKPLRLKALLLAAGAGRRFGGGKLLAPRGDGRLIDGALAAALAAPVMEVIAVTGADHELLSAHLSRRAPQVRIVQATDWAAGMSASLKAGARAAGEIDGLFVFLGDMPDIPHALLPKLAEALDAGAEAAAPVHKGHRGHPVLLGRALVARLETLSGDRGAAALLPPHMALVACEDPGVLFDVDHPSQLQGPLSP